MTFYNEMQAMAARQLNSKGAPLTLTRSTAGAYSPATSSAAVTLTTFTVTGAVFDFPAVNAPGSDILRGDKKILISAAGLAVPPQPSDYLTINGAQHSIINVKTLAPAGVPVLYTAQARRGG